MKRGLGNLPKKTNFKKKAWDAFSRYIRSRNVCEFHKRIFEAGYYNPCTCSGVLQACHKISRSKNAILFDERNVFCGCAGSNTWSHFHEVEWDELWRVLWHEDVKYLVERKDLIVHRKAWDYKIICDEYKEKLCKSEREKNG